MYTNSMNLNFQNFYHIFLKSIKVIVINKIFSDFSIIFKNSETKLMV